MTRLPRGCAALAAVAVVGALVATGCGRTGREASLRPAGRGDDVGVYRVRAEDSAGRTRRFKLLLWAGLPDRLHGEVVTPVGTTVMVFDGGGGTLAVTLVREGLAFVGPADGEALAGIFGVAMTLDELVSGLLTGEVASGEYHVARRPAGAGLPEWMEVRGPSRELELELKRRQALPANAAVGNGRPVPGLEVRPLTELELYDVPLEDGEQR